MQGVAARQGGRPAVIALEDVIRAGRELGMRRLSINAVAAQLGVSATALYRYVDGRWELERLVGESLLAELELRDNPDADTEAHLLSFGMQLLEFTAAHPGLASYLQVLFPRGDAGTRLLAAEVEALNHRGYSAESAVMLSSAVASLAICLGAREESNANATGGDQAREFARELHAADDRLADDPMLGAAHAALPQVTSAEFVRLLLAASVKGLMSVIATGRPISEIVAEFTAAGEDR